VRESKYRVAQKF